MPITVEQFKQAFAGRPEDGRATRHDARVAEALKKLKRAVDALRRLAGDSADGIGNELIALVSRYQSVRQQAGRPAADRAAELDEILRMAGTLLDATGKALARSGPASGTGAHAKRSAAAEAGPATQATPDLVNAIIQLDNSDHQPIAGAEVRLGNYVGRTDVNGVVMFQVPPGSYDYTASLAGYFDDACGLKIDARSQHVPWRFSLMRRVRLIIQVKDAQTRIPISCARLRGRTEQATDTEGYAKFTVRPGQHGWLVSADGYPEQPADIRVSGETEHQVEVVLLERERAKGAAPRLMEPHG